MLKTFFVVTAFVLLTVNSYADKEGFKKYLSEEIGGFIKFKEERDKEFADFLKQQWDEFKSNKPVQVDTKPKPNNIPKVSAPSKFQPDKDVLPEDVVIQKPVETPRDIRPNVDVTKAVPLSNDVPKENIRTIALKFYGSDIKLNIDKNLIVNIDKPITNALISKYWTDICRSDYTNFIKEIKLISSEFQLGDWGVYTLVNDISSSIHKDVNDKNIFSWFVLSKLGYNVKIGYTDSNIYLLVPSDKQLYGAVYFNINKVKYYILDSGKGHGAVTKLYTYIEDYQGADKKMDMEISPLNFKVDLYEKNFTFIYNQNRYHVPVKINRRNVEFYRNFPQTPLDVYLNADISYELADSAADELKYIIRGKSEAEAVNIILRFVQTAFEYKTDQAQFGYEKYLLPDETIFYPYSDCEDRSFLFAYLVRKILALDVVLLDYPGHVATAVKFRGGVYGDYISHDGERYTICDPTYINSNIGMTMPSFKNSRPSIVKLRRKNL